MSGTDAVPMWLMTSLVIHMYLSSDSVSYVGTLMLTVAQLVMEREIYCRVRYWTLSLAS